MLTFSLKNRIAFYYIASTAVLEIIIFLVIFHTVDYGVNHHINTHLMSEAEKHVKEIEVKNGQLKLINPDSWTQGEHNTFDVNPVFVEFLDNNHNVVEKSPNLRDFTLSLNKITKNAELIDTYIGNQPIRQSHSIIMHNGKKIGCVLVALSLRDTNMVLRNLKSVLFVAFPLILALLFFIARLIAGGSIKPVRSIIETTNNITRENLSTRIELPKTKDELYILSETINSLLNRIENTMQREKQFTSDASHELRTPLATIKGTLEVLVRKPRTQAEYEDKINYSISEVNRMNLLVDKLTELAKFENYNRYKIESFSLCKAINTSIQLFADSIKEKNISIECILSEETIISSDANLVSILLSNVISNAIKYGKQNGNIVISINKDEDKKRTLCTIADNGIGIEKEELNKIFDAFYRSNPDKHPEINGSGLGLSIVKKITTLLNIDFSIHSEINKGTTVVFGF